ncbi:MAG: hypothetical protein ACLGGX_12780 [Bdellovibrionia bacterium]
MILLIVLGVSVTAMADVRFALEGGTIQEGRNLTDTKSVNRTGYDLNVNIGLMKSSPLYLTLGYLYSSKVENLKDGEFNVFNSSHTYLGAGYTFLGRGTFTIHTLIAYSPFGSLDFRQKSGAEDWEGSGIIFKTGVEAQLSRSFSLSFLMVLVQETFSSRKSGSILTNSSVTQSYMYPIAGLNYSF